MKSLSRSTLLVITMATVGAILGFGREAYIAYAYGATGLTDSFYVAAIIPDLIANWLAYALTNAFIPVLKSEMIQSEPSAKMLIKTVFWNVTYVLSLMCFTAYFIREPLVHIMAPGFSQFQYDEAANLLTIMLISILFSGLSGVMWGIHNAYESFTYPATINIIYNGLLIVTALLASHLGVDSLALGLLVGSIGRFMVQFVPIYRLIEFKWTKQLWHPSMKRLLSAMLPVTLSSGVLSINIVVDRLLASSLTGGQIADLNYASKIGLLPNGLLGVSIATTMYTRFIRHTLANEQSKIIKDLVAVGRWLIFTSLIVSTGFLLMPETIVSLLFRHGAFTLRDVLDTSRPVMIYGMFSVIYLVAPLLTHFFYAQGETWFVSKVSIFAVVLNVLGSVLAVHRFGITGLVLSNAFSQTVYTIMMYRAMMKRLGEKVSGHLWRVIYEGGPPGMAFGLGVVIILLTWQPVNVQLERGILRGLIAVLSGSATTLLYALVWRNNEISNWLLTKVRQIL